jgi:hypothetical protein
MGLFLTKSFQIFIFMWSEIEFEVDYKNSHFQNLHNELNYEGVAGQRCLQPRGISSGSNTGTTQHSYITYHLDLLHASIRSTLAMQ